MYSRILTALLITVCFAFSFNAPAVSTKTPVMIEVEDNEQDACCENLKAIHNSLRIYAEHHKGKFPFPNNREGLSLLWKSDLSAQMLYCPVHKGKAVHKWNVLSDTSCSYTYFGGFTLKDAEKCNGLLPLVCDKLNKHHINVLLANGKIISIEDPRHNGKITSYSKLIDALHKTCHYPKFILKTLSHQAAAMDNGQ